MSVRPAIAILAAALFLLLRPTQTFAQVVINEFIVEPNPEWVEFYNASSSAEFLKSYWIDDDTAFDNDEETSPKKLLTSLNISNPTFPYIEMNSFLNNSGDHVVLFSPEGSIIDQYQYSSSPGSGVSIGRYPDQIGAFVTLASLTKSSANSGPQPTPSPQPTSTPTPTLTPTPTSTPTPAPSPTKSPTPLPTKKPDILGAEQEEPSGKELVLNLGSEETATAEGIADNQDKGEKSKEGSSYSVPLVISTAGTLLLGASGLPWIKKKLQLKKQKKEFFHPI